MTTAMINRPDSAIFAWLAATTAVTMITMLTTETRGNTSTAWRTLSPSSRWAATPSTIGSSTTWRIDQNSSMNDTGSHGHRQRQVAACQPSHHVRRGAAWAATDQNHADGNLRGQMERLAEQPRHARHDHEMRHHAQGHAPRVAGDLGEVVELEGQAHAEHHQPQQRHDGALEADEPGRLQECHDGENQYPVGEGVTDKTTQCSQCTHGQILIEKRGWGAKHPRLEKKDRSRRQLLQETASQCRSCRRLRSFCR